MISVPEAVTVREAAGQLLNIDLRSVDHKHLSKIRCRTRSVVHTTKMALEERMVLTIAIVAVRIPKEVTNLKDARLDKMATSKPQPVPQSEQPSEQSDKPKRRSTSNG
ncbi:hypothetical protein Z517_04222 [Fonsecaea pedrosoi CBS 271.37]|uniref:Uncharacterized protein n=1 Tax=Fonsecaea pedrosoi CBS 271.37 TaxID=1442368 RepID=A0A0D2F3E8_9EURO|nr:uncharacterized protein Z517_04222 [Fonsecaea pedrosoi CBS 271.37]KIW81197.1 hypothetical protein Z517_04222 [Fonsecaea pedrosoi CBS 271.37]